MEISIENALEITMEILIFPSKCQISMEISERNLQWKFRFRSKISMEISMEISILRNPPNDPELLGNLAKLQILGG